MVELYFNKELLWKTGDKKIISLASLDIPLIKRTVELKMPEAKITDTEGSITFDFGDDGMLTLGKVRRVPLDNYVQG
jgi:hypothetical protein